jgi:hypothetical protein
MSRAPAAGASSPRRSSSGKLPPGGRRAGISACSVRSDRVGANEPVGQVAEGEGAEVCGAGKGTCSCSLERVSTAAACRAGAGLSLACLVLGRNLTVLSYAVYLFP